MSEVNVKVYGDYSVSPIPVKVMFTTSDGKEFSDERDAIRHCKNLQFDDWYKDNCITGHTGGPMSVFFSVRVDKIKDWLLINRKEIMEFLSSE